MAGSRPWLPASKAVLPSQDGVMDSGQEKQLERIEGIAAEIVEGVRKLHDGQPPLARSMDG
jgi:hypothetical protein